MYCFIFLHESMRCWHAFMQLLFWQWDVGVVPCMLAFLNSPMNAFVAPCVHVAPNFWINVCGVPCMHATINFKMNVWIYVSMNICSQPFVQFSSNLFLSECICCAMHPCMQFSFMIFGMNVFIMSCKREILISWMNLFVAPCIFWSHVHAILIFQWMYVF